MCDESKHNISFSEEAMNTLTAMFDLNTMTQVLRGEDSKESKTMKDSLLRSLATMLRLGGRISNDGGWSLYGITEHGLHYGVIFHKNNDEGQVTDLDGTVVPARDVPASGEWSVHS